LKRKPNKVITYTLHIRPTINKWIKYQLYSPMFLLYCDLLTFIVLKYISDYAALGLLCKSSCGPPSNLSLRPLHYRISSIVWHCVLGNAPSYLLELFILTLACSGGLCGACTTTRQKRAFSIVGPSVWNGLPSDLRSLSRDLPSSFYKLLRLSSLAEPGLGVPLSSYLKGALYKLIYR